MPERRLFQEITEASAHNAMSRACRNVKVPHYHPHDLRHRRITIGPNRRPGPRGRSDARAEV